MNIYSILEENEKSISGFHAQIDLINERIVDQRGIATSAIILSINNEPETKLDAAILIDAVGLDNYLKILGEVVKLRSLSEDELDDRLLSIIERQVYKGKVMPLADAIFDSLDTVYSKLRFALFASGIATIFQCHEKSKAFLTTEFPDIALEHSRKPNSLKFEGCLLKYNIAGIQLTTTKNNYEGFDDIAKMIVKLSDINYPVPFISVFEHSLSRSGSYHINFNFKDEDGELRPYLSCSSYDVYFGQGETYVDKIVDVLRYVADHHWYAGGKDDEDSDEYDN